jgi:hypothetical protein
MNTKREETKTRPDDAAFPQNPHTLLDTGLTKREYFAAMALQGFIANPDNLQTAERFAFAAVKMADALIEELNKE